MKLMMAGLVLLLCSQLVMFRNPNSDPVLIPALGMLIGSGLFFRAIRGVPLPEEAQTDTVPEPQRVRVQPVFLLVGLALILWTTFRAIQPHVSFWEQILTWIGAFGAFWFAFRDEAGSRLMPSLNRDHLLIFALFAAALVLHLADLNRLPALLDQDEALFANEGAQIVLNQFSVSPFAPGIQSHPYLFQGFIGLSIALFGQTIFAARLLSAVLGALGIPAIYLLSRALFDRLTGLFAALFALTWPFHVLFARLAMNQPADPLFITLAFYQLIVGLRHGRVRPFILCGIFLGVGQLFYLGGRLGPLVLIAFLIWLAMRQPDLIRKRWRGLLLTGLMFVLAALPQHFYLLHYRQPLTTRMWVSWVATGQLDWLSAHGVDQVYRSFMGLFSLPDPSWYGSSSSLLNFTGGPLLLIGVVVALRLCWKRPNDALPLGWAFAVIILGSTFSATPPQYQRYYPGVTALALLVGVGGVTVTRSISGLLRRPSEFRDFTIASAGVVSLLNLGFLLLVYFPEARYFDNRANKITNQLAFMMRAAADEGKHVVLYRNPIPAPGTRVSSDEVSSAIYISNGVDDTSVVKYVMAEHPYTFKSEFELSAPAQVTPPAVLFVPFLYRDMLPRMNQQNALPVRCVLSTLQTDGTPAFYVCNVD